MEASIQCSGNNYPSNLGNNTPRLLDETNSILNVTAKTCYCNKLGEAPTPAPTPTGLKAGFDSEQSLIDPTEI